MEEEGLRRRRSRAGRAANNALSTKVGDATPCSWLLARTSRGLTVSRTFVTMCSVLRTIYLCRVISDLSSRRRRRGTPMRDRLRDS